MESNLLAFGEAAVIHAVQRIFLEPLPVLDDIDIGLGRIHGIQVRR